MYRSLKVGYFENGLIREYNTKVQFMGTHSEEMNSSCSETCQIVKSGNSEVKSFDQVTGEFHCVNVAWCRTVV